MLRLFFIVALFCTCLAPMASGDTNIPEPNLCIVPSTLTMTADGSFDYIITVNGPLGPVVGALVEVRVRPAADALICWAAGATHPSVFGNTNTFGQVTFNLMGGGCIDPARFGQSPVDIFADGINIAEVGVNSPDVVNALGQLATDIGYVQDSICETSVGDAAFHATQLFTAASEFCTDFTDPFTDPVGIADGVILTSYIAGGGGGSTPAGTAELNDVKLAIHLQSVNSKTCAASPASMGCGATGGDALVTAGALNTNYHAYFLALDVDPVEGLSGAAFSLTSSNPDNLYVDFWDGCNAIWFPSATWPQIGSGNVAAVGPVACQPNPDPSDPEGEGFVVLGRVYVYAYGVTDLSYGQRPTANPSIDISDCSNRHAEIPLGSRLGTVEFGGGSGSSPCVPSTLSTDLINPRPRRLALGQIFPNPVQQSSLGFSIPIQLEQSGALSFQLLDLQGRLVDGKDWDSYAAGDHIVHWKPKETAPGVYFLRVKAKSGETGTRRVTIVD